MFLLAIIPAENNRNLHRSSPSYRAYSFAYVRGKFAPFNVEIITRRIKISSHSFMASAGMHFRNEIAGQKKKFQPPSPVITMHPI